MNRKPLRIVNVLAAGRPVVTWSGRLARRLRREAIFAGLLRPDLEWHPDTGEWYLFPVPARPGYDGDAALAGEADDPRWQAEQAARNEPDGGRV